PPHQTGHDQNQRAPGDQDQLPLGTGLSSSTTAIGCPLSTAGGGIGPGTEPAPTTKSAGPPGRSPTGPVADASTASARVADTAAAVGRAAGSLRRQRATRSATGA